MPIISREKTFINGKPFEKVTRVLKDGLFRIKMPSYITDSLGVIDVYHETRAGVEKEYQKLVQQYIATKTSETKVILYQFKMSGFVQGPAKYSKNFDPENDDPMETVCLHRSEDFSFDKGMIVGVKARIYIEVRNERENGEVFYRYNKVALEDDLPLGILDQDLPRLQNRGEQISSDNRLEWTQERHDFFVSIYNAMSQLILKLEHLTEPEGLLAAIKNQRRIIFNEERTRDDITEERTW